ncbi:unnamed protein product, partial [Didymodactylos carnosus]
TQNECDTMIKNIPNIVRPQTTSSLQLSGTDTRIPLNDEAITSGSVSNAQDVVVSLTEQTRVNEKTRDTSYQEEQERQSSSLLCLPPALTVRSNVNSETSPHASTTTESVQRQTTSIITSAESDALFCEPTNKNNMIIIKGLPGTINTDNLYDVLSKTGHIRHTDDTKAMLTVSNGRALCVYEERNAAVKACQIFNGKNESKLGCVMKVQLVVNGIDLIGQMMNNDDNDVMGEDREKNNERDQNEQHDVNDKENNNNDDVHMLDVLVDDSANTTSHGSSITVDSQSLNFASLSTLKTVNMFLKIPLSPQELAQSSGSTWADTTRNLIRKVFRDIDLANVNYIKLNGKHSDVLKEIYGFVQENHNIVLKRSEFNKQIGTLCRNSRKSIESRKNSKKKTTTNDVNKENNQPSQNQTSRLLLENDDNVW